MKINEIYNKYHIVENLQNHMYRVAAVGSLIVDYLGSNIKLDKDIVIKTLLLHDLGNILKFDFNSDLLNKEDVENLKKTREEFILKYGDNEHSVTQNIIREIGVSDKILEILENTGSSKVYSVVDSDNWYFKICSYADFRVAPYGVVSIDERFDDVVKRYKGRDHILSDIKNTEHKRMGCLALEKQIQEKCKIPLLEINNSIIEPIVYKLLEYEIK